MVPIQDSSALRAALELLGRLLEQRQQPVELAIIGGSGLILAGLTDRTTRDVDVVALHRDGALHPADELPPTFFTAVRQVAEELGLESNWLNTGPKDLLRFGLPDGFLARCERRRFHGLTALIASRFDQVHLKLYAATDDGPRGRHFQDLLLLQPSSAELLMAGHWCRSHDPSPAFRSFLVQAMRAAGWEGNDEDL